MGQTAIDLGNTAPDRPVLGRAGEDAALRWYRDHGYTPVVRNWRCPLGELDLVLERAGLLVFCEVKTRTSSAFGGGFEAVTQRKQRKLRQLGEVFLLTTGRNPARVRFDVASVLAGWSRRGAVEVEIFEDAF